MIIKICHLENTIVVILLLKEKFDFSVLDFVVFNKDIY